MQLGMQHADSIWMSRALSGSDSRKDMKTNYLVHEEMYVQARQAGWEGWGGNERMSKPILVERFLALEGCPTRGRLLELGCGEGHHCRAFYLHGFEVTGVDISETAIAWAREKAQLADIAGEYVVADLTAASLELTERYDVVIDGNCLHCIIGNDRTTFLNHVYRLLSENGVFFVSSLCSKDGNSHHTYKDGYTYRCIPSKENLVSELEEAGFEVRNVEVYERNASNHITVYAVKA